MEPMLFGPSSVFSLRESMVLFHHVDGRDLLLNVFVARLIMGLEVEKDSGYTVMWLRPLHPGGATITYTVRESPREVLEIFDRHAAWEQATQGARGSEREGFGPGSLRGVRSEAPASAGEGVAVWDPWTPPGGSGRQA